MDANNNRTKVWGPAPAPLQQGGGILGAGAGDTSTFANFFVNTPAQVLGKHELECYAQAASSDFDGSPLTTNNTVTAPFTGEARVVWSPRLVLAAGYCHAAALGMLTALPTGRKHRPTQPTPRKEEEVQAMHLLHLAIRVCPAVVTPPPPPPPPPNPPSQPSPPPNPPPSPPPAPPPSPPPAPPPSPPPAPPPPRACALRLCFEYRAKPGARRSCTRLLQRYSSWSAVQPRCSRSGRVLRQLHDLFHRRNRTFRVVQGVQHAPLVLICSMLPLCCTILSDSTYVLPFAELCEVVTVPRLSEDRAERSGLVMLRRSAQSQGVISTTRTLALSHLVSCQLLTECALDLHLL